MSGRIRPAAVDGRFYPSDPATLRQAIAYLLDHATPPDSMKGLAPKAIIAPHAGYEYSGPIAATAYATLVPRRGSVESVIVAGPSHFWHVDGVAVPSASAFATPLGDTHIDDAARCRALDVAGVVVDDRAHAAEHSLEVQLPFVTEVLGDVKLIPLAVGRSASATLTAVLEVLWGGDETCIVISTDLSHYLPADVARTLDERTAAAICRLEPPEAERACGAAAVAGMLAAAREHQLDVRLLDLRNSADTAGDPDRVVGYGAFELRERVLT